MRHHVRKCLSPALLLLLLAAAGVLLVEWRNDGQEPVEAEPQQVSKFSDGRSCQDECALNLRGEE